MSNPFKTASVFLKSAGDPVTDKAISDVGQLALMSLGVGAAARGGVGLYNMARRSLAPHRVVYPGAVVTKMPYPVRGPAGQEEEDKQAAADPTALPYYYPAMVGTGMAGLYGGWKALDTVLDSRRKAEEKEQLTNARKGFESSLLQNYQQPREAKLASDASGDRLSAALDGLFDGMVKTANPDWLNRLAGGYLGFYALPTAGITAAMAYNAQRGNSTANATDKAMQQRNRRSYWSRPSEILTVPEPVPVGQEPQPEEDERSLRHLESAAA